MAGTKKTKGALITWIDAYINTNGTNAITGALLNQAFNDIIESILFGTEEGENNIAVAYNGGAGTTVTFPDPLPSANYRLVVRIYDANGDGIDATIDPALETANGFHILPVADGLIDYRTLTLDV